MVGLAPAIHAWPAPQHIDPECPIVNVADKVLGRALTVSIWQ
jgi:hypothetical protein